MKNKDYFVYLISSNNLHNEMIQNYLKNYDITCITKKEYDYGKETDSIHRNKQGGASYL